MMFPILAMIDLLTRDLFKNSALKSLTHLRLLSLYITSILATLATFDYRALEICIQLNLAEGISFHELLADYKLKEVSDIIWRCIRFHSMILYLLGRSKYRPPRGDQMEGETTSEFSRTDEASFT